MAVVNYVSGLPPASVTKLAPAPVDGTNLSTAALGAETGAKVAGSSTAGSSSSGTNSKGTQQGDALGGDLDDQVPM